MLGEVIRDVLRVRSPHTTYDLIIWGCRLYPREALANPLLDLLSLEEPIRFLSLKRLLQRWLLFQAHRAKHPNVYVGELAQRSVRRESGYFASYRAPDDHCYDSDTDHSVHDPMDWVCEKIFRWKAMHITPDHPLYPTYQMHDIGWTTRAMIYEVRFPYDTYERASLTRLVEEKSR